MDDYEALTLRNADYIEPALQRKIRDTRRLIAEFGIGSSLAEAVRLGFEHFILADGLRFRPHSQPSVLFRGGTWAGRRSKRARRMREINPAAEIKMVNNYLDGSNIPVLVAAADVVFDTVDFLDLAATVSLHAGTMRARKPLLTALAIG